MNNKINDPEWIKCISNSNNKLENKKYKEFVKELFLQYKSEGLSSMEAFRKAIKVADSFNL